MSDSPSIVWINLESVRHDHTTLGGYHRETTPNLERIANSQDGLSFDRCFSHAHWTAPSCSTILSGTYPARHGIGVGPEGNDALPSALRTVPELLSDAGYHTAGLTGNGYSGPASGLDRGFDEYTFFRGDDVHRTLGLRTVLKYLLNIRRHGGGLTARTTLHGTSFMMNDVLKRWTTRFAERDQPFYLWTHYGDPHHPYTPPKTFIDRFTHDIEMSPEEAREFAIHAHENLHSLIAHGCDFTQAEWDALEAMYDAEIAYTDTCIGRLFDHVQSLGLDDVVFLVTGDHGELFGERGLISHKIVLNDATTHVPMVTHGLDGVAHQTGNIVQHIDFVRTLVEAAGGDTAQLQGFDLREEEREFAVSQTSGDIADYTEYNPAFDASRFHTSPLTSLRTEGFRYQKSREGAELFELPDEETDVSDAFPDVAREFDERLSDWQEKYGGIAGTEEHSIDAEMQQHLEDMGYMA